MYSCRYVDKMEIDYDVVWPGFDWNSNSYTQSTAMEKNILYFSKTSQRTVHFIQIGVFWHLFPMLYSMSYETQCIFKRLTIVRPSGKQAKEWHDQ